MKKVAWLVSLGLLVWAIVFIADIYDWPPQSPTKHDSAIIARTIELLQSDAVWYKYDDRHCDNDAKKLSLYCAIQKASYDVSGDFHHESAVMEAVRDAISGKNTDVKYSHILMDFNNSASVSLIDVHAVLNQARNKLRQ